MAEAVNTREQLIEELENLRQQLDELKASEKLRTLEIRYASLLQSGPLAILVSRMRDDCILDINERFERLLGYSREEVVGSTTVELGIFVHPDDRERADSVIREKGNVNDFETKVQTKTGDFRYFLTSVELIEIDNEPCFLRTAYDITERKRVEEQLLKEAYHRALHDPLTELPNRALFLDRLGRSIELAKRRENYIFAVLFMDIDRLKDVNDSLGHLAGDNLLVEVARRLESCLRLGDTVARLGGDEFAILLEDIGDVSEVLRVTGRIHKELARPFELGEQPISITASIGITLSALGYNHPEELLRDADTAMYRAKEKGGGNYEVYDKDLHIRAVARLQLETDLLLAVKNRNFKIHYQPIVSLENGKVVALEALGRWYHPNRGLVSLAEFIPVAEETGLILDIGRWMLQEACEQVRAWQDQFPAHANLRVNVNLAAKEFYQPDLSEQINQVLEPSGLGAQFLTLEVTESVILEKPEVSAQVLAGLKALGMRVLIDDFGKGHSSLNVMYSYPIDGLKIARSFISRMGTGSESSEILRTIVMLARDYGMQATAKGIETEAQLRQLREWKCPYGQGFYFSQPEDFELIAQLLSTDPRW